MSDGLLKEALERQPSCPPLESLAAALDLSSASSARHDAEEHLRNCAPCRVELRMAREFTVGKETAAERETITWITECLQKPAATVPQWQVREPQKPKTSWFRLPWVLTPVLAGFAALALVVMVDLPQSDNSSGDLDRDFSGQQLRAASIDLSAPLGDVNEPPAQFEWKPLAKGERYVLRITEVDGNTVYETSTKSPRATLPANVRKLCLPFKTLNWSVTAMNAGGTQIASSQIGVFRVTPAGEGKGTK